MKKETWTCDRCGEPTDIPYGQDWFVLDTTPIIPVLRLTKPGHKCITADLCLMCYLKEMEYRIDQYRKIIPGVIEGK